MERLEGLPITRIDVRPLDIYDPVPDGRLAPIYRLANRLHVRTREGTVRQHLLFDRGDPWSEAAARETERNLRALDFLYPARIEAQSMGDSLIVSVVTHDIWTTSPEFNLESADGKQYGAVAFTDGNVLGFGKAVSVEFGNDPTGKSRSISFDDPALLGTRARFHLDVGDAGGGIHNRVSAGVPFFSERTRHTYGATWYRSTSRFGLFQRGAQVAVADARHEETEISWGSGARKALQVQRLVWSFLAFDRRFGPSVLAPGAPPEFAGGEENLRLRRLAVEGRLWRPHFVERTAVQRMVLTEDVDLGGSLALKLGMAPKLLGSTVDEGYARLRADIGADQPYGFGWVRGSVETRLRNEPVNLIQQIDARWYAGGTPRQRIVFGAFGIIGNRTDRDFQAVVGGLNGLRAYPIHAVAGQRLWRLNLEERRTIVENQWNLFTIGVVGFVDAARAWGPGATGTDWHVASGVGLRLSTPQLSLNQVLRIDVAWPLEPSRDGQRQPVLSFGSSQAF